MVLRSHTLCVASFILALLLPTAAHAADQEATRERIRLDDTWRFAIGSPSDRARDFGYETAYFSYLAKAGFGDGPAAPAFDDRGWRLVEMPHDWAVEAKFDAKASHSHGYKAIGLRFPDSSVGWYRRKFSISEADLRRRIHLEFDGVFRAAKVFVNGFFLGEQPSGYVGASYDITDYLNYGGVNVIAVRVDASMEEGWFYEGAGIYRHVWLSKTSLLHVARHGTWVRTELNDGNANVLVDTTLANDGREAVECTVEQSVVDPDGRIIATVTSASAEIAPGSSEVRHQTLSVTQPTLWSLENPALHKLVTVIRAGDRIVDRYETPFGIRTAHFDPNAGFFLNGKHVILKGTNNHQDHAGVGAAVPDGLQDYRIRKLKGMGSNAYRASHNPPTPELLDACDRLGMLVIDENRLMGSNDYQLSQLKEMILRDRNHPSVILWSLGNEEWGIEGNIKGARITTTMQDFAHRLDPSRSTTVAISGGWGGTSTVIEAAGVNYIKQGDTDKQHAQYPKQIIIGTEETTTQGTRGIYFDDRPSSHLAAQTDGSSGGNAEIGWKHYAARPYTAGVFFWTGFDYRGEATPFGFPAIASQFGILDTCGFPKDSFYYLKAWWGTEPVLHLYPHWNWPGREGQEIEVRADSNCDEVELSLNGNSLGRQKMEPNGHLTWKVKYTPGTLLARGYRGGREILTAKVETTGLASAVALLPDRTDIKADRNDVSVVAVEIRDPSGNVVPTAHPLVTFSIQGPGKIIGVGNGDPSCLEPDRFVESVRTQTLGTLDAKAAATEKDKIVFEAKFDRPAETNDEATVLILSAIGSRQSVSLNGLALYQNEMPEKARAELPISSQSLRATGNILRIEATPFSEAHLREGLSNLHPAVLRITTPPKPWSRSTFNGLAQVIVQPTGEPGIITLTAEAPTLAPASIKLTALANGAP